MGADVVDFNNRRAAPSASAETEASPDQVIEHYLLAALLRAPRLLEALPDGFGAHHLHYEPHGEVFEAIKAAASSGAKDIYQLVRAALPHLDRHDADGKCVASVVTDIYGGLMACDAGNVRAYAGQVMEASDRRDLLAVAQGMQRELVPVGGEPAAPEAVIAKAVLAFERLQSRQRKWNAAVTVGQAMREAVALGEEAAARDGALSGVSTGLRCLDSRIGGMEPGTVLVLGGRPGAGKTALGLRIAVNAAKTGVPVQFFSQEMPRAQIGRRALALAGDVGLKAVKTGGFMRTGHGASEVVRGVQDFDALPLLIDDEASLTVQAMRLRAKAAKRRMNGLGLIVIDHLHIMGRPESAARHGDTQAITEISAGVKALAKELHVPVLLLAQLNRGVEGREDKRPTLADLRQSGAIEQDADIIMFVYRKSYYTETREDMPPKPRRRGDPGDSVPACLEGPEDKAEILFEKNRDGERGVEYLRYDAPRARFWEEGARA